MTKKKLSIIIQRKKKQLWNKTNDSQIKHLPYFLIFFNISIFSNDFSTFFVISLLQKLWTCTYKCKRDGKTYFIKFCAVIYKWCINVILSSRNKYMTTNIIDEFSIINQ